MKNSIDRYLAELREELRGADRALIQDAIADAEEYLRTALDNPETPSEATEAEAFERIMEKYGSPAEVAAAYRENEARIVRTYVPPALAEKEQPEEIISEPKDTRPWLIKFFGIFADSKAWGALLYLIFALGTGIIYFTWVVTGVSVSAGMLVLIIGIPLALLLLLSVRGIGLVEGRIVEALLGIRMPRRALFSRRDLSFWQKLKGLLSQRQTWTSMVYMFMQLPLGIIYFSVIVTLISVSFWLIGQPVWGLAFDMPFFTDGYYGYYTPVWVMPFSIIGGALLLTATMHIVKFAGKLHGIWAKSMLVRE